MDLHSRSILIEAKAQAMIVQLHLARHSEHTQSNTFVLLAAQTCQGLVAPRTFQGAGCATATCKTNAAAGSTCCTLGSCISNVNMASKLAMAWDCEGILTSLAFWAEVALMRLEHLSCCLINVTVVLHTLAPGDGFGFKITWTHRECD